MGLISDPYPDFIAGQPAVADQVDARFAALYSLVNGNLDAANITDGSITLAELAAAVLNNFPKLKTPADRVEEFGLVSTAGFAGGKTLIGTITHNLGRIPATVQLSGGSIAVFGGSTGNSAVSVSWANLTTTQLTYVATIVDGQSNNATSIYWRVIG